MAMNSRVSSFVERSWAPIVGDFYATLIAAERVHRLKVTTLIYVGAALIDVAAIVVAVRTHEAMLVLIAVAATIPTAVSIVVAMRIVMPSVGERITSDLWSIDVPVIGTMPSTRVGWASTWMHANRVTPAQMAAASNSRMKIISFKSRSIVPPRMLRFTVPLAVIGASLGFAGTVVQVLGSSGSLDAKMGASTTFVFLLTLALIAVSFFLTALCWLDFAVVRGSSTARLTMTILVLAATAAASVVETLASSVISVSDFGLAIYLVIIGLTWSPASSDYVRRMTTAKNDREQKVRDRLASIGAL